jgi:hypothetical protein
MPFGDGPRLEIERESQTTYGTEDLSVGVMP